MLKFLKAKGINNVNFYVVILRSSEAFVGKQANSNFFCVVRTYCAMLLLLVSFNG